MAATVSRWARLFVAAGACWFVVATATQFLGAGRRVTVTLLLFGFVFHTIFGKAYSLVPSYFDSSLAFPRAPTLQFPFTVAGVATLALGWSRFGTETDLIAVGAVSWTLGVAVFATTLAWTVRGNITGAATGTGDSATQRRQTDRLANATVSVAVLYLFVGSYLTLATVTPLPSLLDGYVPRVSHLLAAGSATLFVFSLGFRLYPRFLTVESPSRAAPLVLISGAIGPLLLAVGLPTGSVLLAGAVVETTAVGAFAVTYNRLLRQSNRIRAGLYGVSLGTVFGTVGVILGGWMALDSSVILVETHYRTMLVGFLGTIIVGTTYQFYPPAVGTFRGATDRTARVVLTCLGVGIALGVVSGVAEIVVPGVRIVGTEATFGTFGRIGDGAVFLGSVIHAGLILGLFADRYWS